jgi:hypothetical protein
VGGLGLRAMGGLAGAVIACIALLALSGHAGAAQSLVSFDIAADLSAGGAGDEIAGTSTMRYRCDGRRRLTNRIWFERRAAGVGAWQRIEPGQVRYRLTGFADSRRAGGRVRRASVQAPRSSFAGAGSDDFRLFSRMTFTCLGHKVVARSQTLPLPGLGA